MVSFFIPGLGSAINGEWIRGACYLCGYVAWWIYILYQPSGAYTPLQSFVFLAGASLWIFQMFDAYQGAKRWTQKHRLEHRVDAAVNAARKDGP